MCQNMSKMNKAISLNLIDSKSRASSILDLIRFISALMVFLMHFYVPVPGYQCVMVFFVLSGYFISSSIYKQLKMEKWNWSDYFVKRITRLWVVLIPSLILTYIWSKIQFNLFGITKISNYLGIKHFLGNLFFLQGIIVHTYGSNGPLWSLSYEFWYYTLFPIFLLIFFSKKVSMKFMYACLFLLISYFVGIKIMEYFLIWLLGAILPLVKPLILKKVYFKNIMLLSSFMVALISMKCYVFFVRTPDLQIIPDFSVGLGFAILFYLIISFYSNKRDSLLIKISNRLAGFSYTLYLTHYPVAIFIMTWFASPLWPFGKPTLPLKATFAICVLVYAWIISLATEKQTSRIRNLISKILFKNKRNYVFLNQKVTKTNALKN